MCSRARKLLEQGGSDRGAAASLPRGGIFQLSAKTCPAAFVQFEVVYGHAHCGRARNWRIAARIVRITGSVTATLAKLEGNGAGGRGGRHSPRS